MHWWIQIQICVQLQKSSGWLGANCSSSYFPYKVVVMWKNAWILELPDERWDINLINKNYSANVKSKWHHFNPQKVKNALVFKANHVEANWIFQGRLLHSIGAGPDKHLQASAILSWEILGIDSSFSFSFQIWQAE